MRMTIKEKAGLPDKARIFEGLHLTEDYIRVVALNPDNIKEPEFKKAGDHHFSICDKCRKEKESYLPLSSSDAK